MTADPTITYQAIRALEAELPALVGPTAWPVIEVELGALHRRWADALDEVSRMRVAVRYRILLAPHAAARGRLHRAESERSFYQETMSHVAALVEQGGNSQAAAELRHLGRAEASRLLFLKEVGEPSRSVKLKNLSFDFGKLTLTAAAILGAVAMVVDPAAAGLSSAAAVLLILNELYKAMEREISVDDASVLWGLIEAGGEAKQASLSVIVAVTNDARGQPALPALTAVEVLRALRALERLKAVAEDKTTGLWRIIEEHGTVEG